MRPVVYGFSVYCKYETVILNLYFLAFLSETAHIRASYTHICKNTLVYPAA